MDACESESEAETIKYTEENTQEAFLISIEDIPMLGNPIKTEGNVDQLNQLSDREFCDSQQDEQEKVLFDHGKKMDSSLVGQLKCDTKLKQFVNVARLDGQSKSRESKTKTQNNNAFKLNDDAPINESEGNLLKSHYKCLQCDKRFPYKSTMLIHARIHLSEEKTPHRFQCPECNKGFYYAAHLRKHSRVHTGETPFVCSICQKGFKHVSHLKRHSLYHRMQINGVPAEKSHCDMCGNYYTNIGQHMKTHLGIVLNRKDRVPFKEAPLGEAEGQCTLCSKSFRQPRQLKRHMRIHTGDFSHKCDHCHKYFHERSDLVVHQRVHSGVYPFSCAECNHKFRSSGNFHRHMRENHEVDKTGVKISKNELQLL